MDISTSSSDMITAPITSSTSAASSVQAAAPAAAASTRSTSSTAQIKKVVSVFMFGSKVSSRRFSVPPTPN